MKQTLNSDEKRKQRVAILVMCLICIPILLLYGVFFRMAFYDEAGGLTLSNFRFLYEAMEIKQTKIDPITKALYNSVFFTVVVTSVEVVISCLAGYAISRLQFRGRSLIQYALLALRMFPNLLLLIGVLYVLIEIKMANRMIGVLLVAIAFRVPGSTFIIKNFFDGIPRDIENSTLVDGCSRFSAFFQVIIHLVKPGIASISVFSFMSAWSNYILFNTLIFNSKTPVIATYLRSLSSNEQMIASYGVFAAMALIYMLPVIVFFIISQKSLMEGNLASGKGV
ncbi:carbohydrate ABC transporter permease [Lachnospiraceae bacterium OttesenSCG-928-D06]|nr:carbohydrate ABC transporter permease [Lachnospiraceae bacterium OttesenSCG-928-D06]